MLVLGVEIQQTLHHRRLNSNKRPTMMPCCRDTTSVKSKNIRKNRSNSFMLSWLRKKAYQLQIAMPFQVLPTRQRHHRQTAEINASKCLFKKTYKILAQFYYQLFLFIEYHEQFIMKILCVLFFKFYLISILTLKPKTRFHQVDAKTFIK